MRVVADYEVRAVIDAQVREVDLVVFRRFTFLRAPVEVADHDVVLRRAFADPSADILIVRERCPRRRIARPELLRKCRRKAEQRDFLVIYFK